MTDIRAGIQRMRGVCVAYGMCIPAACTATMFGATAQAGAWGEFEARCLMPFEKQASADVDGLVLGLQDGTVAAFDGFDEPFISMSTGEIAGTRFCAVIGRENSPDEAGAWVEASLKSGRYVPMTMDNDDWFASNEWIEPRIAVRIHRSNEITQYYVLETDLES
ncbi:hypothetical protein [Ascidiaceihabitans donghaensis]|nr:hypothetical protein [Ascidiaceihabitans donghaensis]